MTAIAALDSTAQWGATTAVAWGDHDADGDLDLFVGDGYNSSVAEQGYLFTQYFNPENERPKFSHANPWATSYEIIQKAVTGAQWADVDADGNLDLVVSGRGYPSTAAASHVYWGDGSGDFSVATDLPPSDAVTIADINLDGASEIGLSHVVSDTKAIPAIWASAGGGNPRSLTDATVSYGLQTSRIGESSTLRSIVLADVAGDGPNGDGDPDLLLGRKTGVGDEFFLENPIADNATTSPDWIRVRLNGLDNTINEGSGAGAVVRVTTDPGTATERTQTQIMGLGAVGTPVDHLLFGLGESGSGAEVEVTWPDGFVQSTTLGSINTELQVVDNHQPSLLGATAGAVGVLQPDSTFDWVFSWQTENSTDPALDEVRVKRDSDGICPSMSEVVLTESSPDVTLKIVPLANGNFLHSLSWHGRTCQVKCVYDFKVKSATSEGGHGTGWKTFSISVCAN